ncbi:MAG: threonylcarbamoyl-AMP synthase [Bacteroidales bacterium]|jgi:tRNA threonylcarbamoyl adenosine modification protein (Sua5/YciO/YrdC/YwlC family)|nr:threonylcarbamoyl-AMP synthase [Bacteroidales bacterium]
MMTKIYPENPNAKEIEAVAKILHDGGIVVYPTDTVYGIGCDIYNRKAVERIAQIKGLNPEKVNFSFICRDLSHLSEYARQVSNATFKLMKHHLPGPFTFILNAGSKVPKILESKKKTVGIRIPDHAVALAIVERFGNPILSTSVQLDDEMVEYATDPELIHEKYEDLVDLVIDSGLGGYEYSTVVDCTGDEPEIIRQGLGILDV